MPSCVPWRKQEAESRSLSEIYKPPDCWLTKDVLLGEGDTGDVYKGLHHRRGVVAVKMANISRVGYLSSSIIHIIPSGGVAYVS
ncbi:hypothetical protein XENTR_v10018718 [Xenopus tropicalis]|nr:hypothetical protein XENTR_v10018718 [Xenopus tropicalis]